MREQDVLVELKRRLPQILPLKQMRWREQQALGDHRFDVLVEALLRSELMRLAIEVESQPNLAKVRQWSDRLRAWRNSVVHSHPNYVPLLVAPHLNQEMRRLCKELGQPFLDLSGNVWLDMARVLIEKEVAKNLYPHEARSRSPFADKASLVLRHLFLYPESDVGVRDIAKGAGLSAGYVSKVVRAATEREYLNIDPQGRPRLKNHREVLEDWSSFYHWRKNSCEAYFCRKRRPEDMARVIKGELASVRDEYAFSLHSGNNRLDNYVSSGILHVYAKGDGVVERLKKALRLEPVAEDAGNVAFLRPYYAESVFFGARIIEGLRVVSDLQLYLDLRHYPLRGVEAAERILEKRLRPMWERKHGRA